MSRVKTEYWRNLARDLIASVTPVENGFISVIGYQEKGYALIPIG